jgi:hypothetical protein
VTDTLHAYQLAKRGNALRVMAEAVRWAKRGARVNTISPGIIITPLAADELTGPRGEGYRRMIELSPAGRAGTPDEVATLAAILMGPDGTFITGSDFLMDGGVTASYFFGDLAPQPWLPDHVPGTEVAHPDDTQKGGPVPQRLGAGGVGLLGASRRRTPRRAGTTHTASTRPAWTRRLPVHLTGGPGTDFLEGGQDTDQHPPEDPVRPARRQPPAETILDLPTSCRRGVAHFRSW